jgi:hypothetical protein
MVGMTRGVGLVVEPDVAVTIKAVVGMAVGLTIRVSVASKASSEAGSAIRVTVKSGGRVGVAVAAPGITTGLSGESARDGVGIVGVSTATITPGVGVRVKARDSAATVTLWVGVSVGKLVWITIG